MMNWIGWALVAAGLAVTMEALYRSGIGWHEYPWAFVLPALAVNYAVYRLVAAGPTLLVALAAFSCATALARAGVSQFVVHESVARGNLVAAAVLFFGVVIGATWR